MWISDIFLYNIYSCILEAAGEAAQHPTSFEINRDANSGDLGEPVLAIFPQSVLILGHTSF